MAKRSEQPKSIHGKGTNQLPAASSPSPFVMSGIAIGGMMGAFLAGPVGAALGMVLGGAAGKAIDMATSANSDVAAKP